MEGGFHGGEVKALVGKDLHGGEVKALVEGGLYGGEMEAFEGKGSSWRGGGHPCCLHTSSFQLSSSCTPFFLFHLVTLAPQDAVSLGWRLFSPWPTR